MRGLALSKRGGTGPICARARPEHVFQASQANAKIGLSDQHHEPRRRRTRMLDGCVGQGKGGDICIPAACRLKAMDPASLALEHDLCMRFGIGQQ